MFIKTIGWTLRLQGCQTSKTAPCIPQCVCVKVKLLHAFPSLYVCECVCVCVCVCVYVCVCVFTDIHMADLCVLGMYLAQGDVCIFLDQ